MHCDKCIGMFLDSKNVDMAVCSDFGSDKVNFQGGVCKVGCYESDKTTVGCL